MQKRKSKIRTFEEQGKLFLKNILKENKLITEERIFEFSCCSMNLVSKSYSDRCIWRYPKTNFRKNIFSLMENKWLYLKRFLKEKEINRRNINLYGLFNGEI